MHKYFACLQIFVVFYFPQFLIGQVDDSIKLLITAAYENVQQYEDFGFFQSYSTSSDGTFIIKSDGTFKFYLDKPNDSLEVHSEVEEFFGEKLTAVVLKKLDITQVYTDSTKGYLFMLTGNGMIINVDTVDLNTAVAMAVGTGYSYLHFLLKLLMNSYITGHDSFLSDVFIRIDDGLTPEGVACYRFKRQRETRFTEEDLKDLPKSHAQNFLHSKYSIVEEEYWFRKDYLLLVKHMFSRKANTGSIVFEVLHEPIVKR